MDGFSSKINNNPINEFPAILIGQFAKSENCKNKITGKEIMNYCFNSLLNGQDYLAGRIIMLECKNEEKLINFYKKFGFELLDKQYKENELLQMIRILKEEELIGFKSNFPYEQEVALTD